MTKNYVDTYNDFWKELVEDKHGNLSKEKMMRELHDFKMVMENVSKVYMHITNSRISKPNTLAEVVIEQADEYYEDLVKHEKTESI